MSEPLTISDVRPEVQAFALAMEQRLRENDLKPGWKDDDARDLYTELDDAHIMLDEFLGFDKSSEHTTEALSEAINSGNYSMMIWDVLQRNAPETVAVSNAVDVVGSDAQPNEEDARLLSERAASVVAEVFFAQGWALKGIDGLPSEEQIAAVILDVFQEAFNAQYPFLHDYRRDRIRVEILPDLKAAHVWLRVGDLHWP